MKNKNITNHILHGCDYNPDQWINYPEILNEDIRLMPLANLNVMTVGVFSWTLLEPREGEYDFTFMDKVFDSLHSIGIKIILATPSGARPNWMSRAHPEVLRVNENRQRILHGMRHNHCFTSPYYRKKVHDMNEMLAIRYKNHPALYMWHVSNEYTTECHCDLCQQEFRKWLKIKYNNNLNKLNHAYWSAFWSHIYTSWDEIESPSSVGEDSIDGLWLDWKRFVTDQSMDFLENETEPLKRITPDIPVTTNFVDIEYWNIDYSRFHQKLDIISWDSYPEWHCDDNITPACKAAFTHDFYRSLKDKPFLLMESAPGTPSWKKYNKVKRPGMHILSSIQAVAHGSDSVQYFQWRKGRGGVEKHHGAVVDHVGTEETRIFKEVSKLGQILEKLDSISGTKVKSDVAVIYDYENKIAIDKMVGPSKDKKYDETCINHYKSFWKQGINVDVIDSSYDFDKYKLVIAPMLCMLKTGVAQKIKDYVKNGGNIVFTYMSGWLDESGLCHLGGFPGDGLREVFGIWAEEIDNLYPGETVRILADAAEYNAIDYCELIHPEGAEILARFDEDYYKAYPALTVNSYGRGKAYYIAFRAHNEFLDDFYRGIIKEHSILKNINFDLPNGVTVHSREDESLRYLFFENYTSDNQKINIDCEYTDILGEPVSNDESIELMGYSVKILKCKKIEIS